MPDKHRGQALGFCLFFSLFFTLSLPFVYGS